MFALRAPRSTRSNWRRAQPVVHALRAKAPWLALAGADLSPVNNTYFGASLAGSQFRACLMHHLVAF
jgi:hypothetical protein